MTYILFFVVIWIASFILALKFTRDILGYVPLGLFIIGLMVAPIYFFISLSHWLDNFDHIRLFEKK